MHALACRVATIARASNDWYVVLLVVGMAALYFYTCTIATAHGIIGLPIAISSNHGCQVDRLDLIMYVSNVFRGVLFPLLSHSVLTILAFPLSGSVIFSVGLFQAFSTWSSVWFFRCLVEGLPPVRQREGLCG